MRAFLMSVVALLVITVGAAFVLPVVTYTDAQDVFVDRSNVRL